jgi:hypothetical protein
MSDPINFEATGNMSDWPKNVPGKPTHVAVFGMYHPTKGRTCEIIWTGEFPDLEPAMYWAAKKEVHAVRKLKWYVASRVLWQHDLTPEQAVEVVRKEMEPQLDRALKGASSGSFDMGPGPMRPVDPKEVKGYYVELERNDGPSGPVG